MKYTYSEGDKVWEIHDCLSCNGKGQVWYSGCADSTEQCYPCNGTGMIRKKRKVKNEAV